MEIQRGKPEDTLDVNMSFNTTVNWKWTFYVNISMYVNIWI